jgi:CheY-like chemotaxis protein
MRVLVVEDESIARDAVRQYLEFRGHDVAVAGSAREAIDLASRCEPDVLLCDWKLNDTLDGVDVAQTLQKRYDLAVILITAHQLDDLKAKAGRAGLNVNAYRRKPVSLASLAEVIESLEIRH